MNPGAHGQAEQADEGAEGEGQGHAGSVAEAARADGHGGAGYTRAEGLAQTDDLVVVTWDLRHACRGLPPEDVEAAWTGNPATLHRLVGTSRRARRGTPT